MVQESQKSVQWLLRYECLLVEGGYGVWEWSDATKGAGLRK
jgi:hypothetical protein